ncbi:MAG TPA: alpha/beta hydrolase [Rhodothermales bacterium]|nr:alpha/beta hydrolase [Rhodothermales bacterium]
MIAKLLGSLATAALLLPSTQAIAQAAECPSTTQTVEVNETTLHYVECGEGDPIVLVHGSTGDLNSLSQHAQLLAPEFRTIAYSRRFHFPNDPPQEGDAYALQQHVDDLAALITELDLGPVHLVGHSYGGYVSLAFALEHPDLVRSLVLGEPPVKPLLSRTSVGEALSASFDRRVFDPSRKAYVEQGLEEGLRRFYDGVIYPGWFDGLSAESRRARVEKAGPEHRLEALTERSVLMPTLACDALSGLDRPVLLLTGEESPAMFLLITAELESCLGGESHVMVPEVGHGGLFSSVSLVHDTMLSFLNNQ